MDQPAIFRVHFDGPITTEHKLPLRVMAKTYECMQRAIDRAYLIEKHGEVSKHARLKEEEYPETEFIALYPQPGGIILDGVRAGAGRIVDRIRGAFKPVFDRAAEQAVSQFRTLNEQLADKRHQAAAQTDHHQRFDDLLRHPPQEWANRYSNRSIVKELDQIVSQIALERFKGSTVEVVLQGKEAHDRFPFTEDMAIRFHRLAASRQLGDPVTVTGVITDLDRGNRSRKPSAKLVNAKTRREVKLLLKDKVDCDRLRDFHNDGEVSLLVCPVMEALGFDLLGGDLIFLDLA